MKQPALIVLAALALGLGGCSLKEPGSPSWDVELTVPLADRSYSLVEIVSDSAEVDSLGNWISDTQGIPVFNFADSLDKSYINNELQFDGFEDLTETYVGVRTVESPGAQTTNFPIGEIAPQFPTGQTVAIPAFNIDPPPNDLEAYPEYDWAYLESGEATVKVTNNLPTPVQDLTIDAYGQDPPILILRVEVPGMLEPGQSAYVNSVLPAAEEIDNVFQLRISGYSPGSWTPVLIEAGDNIEVEVALSPLGVTSARAHLEAQTFYEDTTYTMAESDTVSLAVVKQGSVNYTIENATNLINTITFLLPDFTLNGQPFMDQATISPHGVHQVTGRSLVGYQLSRPQQDNQIQVQVISEILDTADPTYSNPDSLVVVDQGNLVTTEFEVSDLVFSYFEGDLDTVEVNIDQEPQVLEGIPAGLESLEVESAFGGLHLYNTMGLPADVYVTLSAYKNGSEEAAMDLPLLLVPAGNPLNPGILDTTFGGMENLVNVLPDSILISGKAYIAGEGTLADDQYVEGYFHLYSPFFFTLEETSLEPQMSVLDDGLAEELSQVDLAMDLENHLPLTGEAMILASFDSSQFGNPNSSAVDTLLRAPLPQAQLDAEGYVMAPGVSAETETLDEEALGLFENASPENPIYIQTLILLNSTEGDTVRCLTSDFIKVGATAHLIMGVNTGGDN